MLLAHTVQCCGDWRIWSWEGILRVCKQCLVLEVRRLRGVDHSTRVTERKWQSCKRAEVLVCSAPTPVSPAWSRLGLREPKGGLELSAHSRAWQTNNHVIDGSSAFVIYLPCFFPSPNRADKEGFARQSCTFSHFFPLTSEMQFSLLPSAVQG